MRVIFAFPFILLFIQPKLIFKVHGLADGYALHQNGHSMPMEESNQQSVGTTNSGLTLASADSRYPIFSSFLAGSLVNAATKIHLHLQKDNKLKRFGASAYRFPLFHSFEGRISKQTELIEQEKSLALKKFGLKSDELPAKKFSSGASVASVFLGPEEAPGESNLKIFQKGDVQVLVFRLVRTGENKSHFYYRLELALPPQRSGDEPRGFIRGSTEVKWADDLALDYSVGSGDIVLLVNGGVLDNVHLSTLNFAINLYAKMLMEDKISTRKAMEGDSKAPTKASKIFSRLADQLIQTFQDHSSDLQDLLADRYVPRGIKDIRSDIEKGKLKVVDVRKFISQSLPFEENDDFVGGDSDFPYESFDAVKFESILEEDLPQEAQGKKIMDENWPHPLEDYQSLKKEKKDPEMDAQEAAGDSDQYFNPTIHIAEDMAAFKDDVEALVTNIDPRDLAWQQFGHCSQYPLVSGRVELFLENRFRLPVGRFDKLTKGFDGTYLGAALAHLAHSLASDNIYYPAPIALQNKKTVGPNRKMTGLLQDFTVLPGLVVAGGEISDFSINLQNQLIKKLQANADAALIERVWAFVEESRTKIDKRKKNEGVQRRQAASNEKFKFV